VDAMVINKKEILSKMNSGEKEYIRSEQIAIAYKQAFASIFPLFFGASVILSLLYDTDLSSFVAFWFAIILMTLVWRIWLLRDYHRNLLKCDTPTWERRFKYVMYTSAFVWGCSAFFIFHTSDLLHQFFLIFLIAGISSIASGTLASLFGLSVVFLTFLLTPLFLVMLVHGGFEFHMMAILVITFLILLVNASRRIHLNIMSALKSKILHEKATQALEFSEEKIKHQAYFDALTDIPNRILLKDRVEQSLSHYRRHGDLIAIMFLDLDHFKSINDSLGHYVGDLLLIETAVRLSRICREEDTVARLGGDEFIVLLNELGQDPHNAAKYAERIAEKIHEALSQPFDVGERESINTSSSIGIAIVSSDDQSADDLLKFADTAMYQAKKEGRNTTRFYQEQMDQWIKKRLFLENALRHAIKNSELELYYQPVIEIATKRIIGAEALLRWNHPELGLVMPDEMISIAEESGLIVSIGEWVLREACTQFVRWRSENLRQVHIDRIAINVSVVQFRQNDFVDKVIRIVAESGIVPSMLELELTESTVIDNIDIVIEKMNRLRSAGINISMDDFGTGYSSLSYLKRLPFTTLKIDRSFVRDIMSDADDAALVETILSMASIFKFDVIAEGVETIDQFKFLEEHGCQYFQGYLCSKPVQVSQFEELLTHDIQSCTV
jgi:diguanylate cyclase (GGDEF)-like protein